MSSSNNNFFNCIALNGNLATPKYLQIANSIQESIRRGRISRTQSIPSISDLEIKLEISRNTAERSYRHLKLNGVLSSIPGKGYFVSGAVVDEPIRVFLLLNMLSDQKNLLYNAFVDTLGNKMMTDLYIYNNNAVQFETIINNRKDYDYYVIMPHFDAQSDFHCQLMKQIPKDKLVVIGNTVNGLGGKYASVVENYEQIIFKALTKALDQLRKYHTLKIIFPEDAFFPPAIIRGLKKFCICNNFHFKISKTVSEIEINEGEVYINLVERDLVSLIEKIQKTSLTLGHDIGLISYHDSPLNRIVLNGITTISTDFWQMGAIAAQLIQKKSNEHLEVPSAIFMRGSL